MSNLSKPNFHSFGWKVTRSVHFLQQIIRRLTWLVTKKVRKHTLVSQKMSNLSKANFHGLPWQVTWRGFGLELPGFGILRITRVFQARIQPWCHPYNLTLVSQKMCNLSKANFHSLPWQVIGSFLEIMSLEYVRISDIQNCVPIPDWVFLLRWIPRSIYNSGHLFK